MNPHYLKICFLILGLALSPLVTYAQDAQDSAETQPSSTWTSYSENEESRSLGTIDKISFSGFNSLNREVVADIATLKVGDTFTRKKLENSINDLRKWGVFVKVEVLVQYGDKGIELFYELQEGYIIKDIHIRGNYPILESKIQRALFLNPGILYDHAKLPEQIDRLDKLYEKEGYFGTTVLAIEDYDEKHHEVTLHFRIKKGTIYRLRKTSVAGNTALHEGRIKNIIFTFSRFKPKQIKKDLQKITNLYKRKGFVRARVRVGSEQFDYDAHKINLNIVIRQGPKVKVAFEGNEHFFKRTLKKEITVFEDGDFDEFELDASKKRLINFYQERGYENIEVSWERKKLNSKYYLVIFKIQEGKQRKVMAIHFNGNEHFKSSRLLELMATKVESITEKGYYYQPLFEQDLHTIETYYKEEGFLKAEVVSWEKTYSPLGDKVSLDIDLKEGPRAIVESLSIKGLPEATQKTLRPELLLRPGEFYSPSRQKDDIQIILVQLANLGFPYALVKHNVKEIQANKYHITYEITEGKDVEIGRIIFVGNSLTKEKVLRRNLRFKEGDKFSTKNILQSQINLRGLGIFESVSIETLGLTSKRNMVNVVVRVQERKDKILDFEAGYNTDIGFSGKIIFNKLNVWGSGKNTNLKIQVGNQINRIEFNYVDPRTLGTSLQLTLGIFGGRESRPFFRSNSVGVYGSLFKQFGRKLFTWGRLDFGFNDVNDDDTVFNKINPSQIPNDNTSLTSTLGVTYDTRDNFGDPRSGSYLSSTAAFTNQFIQLNGNYSTLKANLGHWYSPFSRITIANALRVAQILTIPSSTIVPADDRLYLGGDNTVRGFKQDALLPSGGTFSLVHNLELQIRVFNKIQVIGFLDTGVVTNGISQVSLRTIRHSAGPGIRYVTPVGPIRLDWGFVLDRASTDATTNRVHFSFGYFF